MKQRRWYQLLPQIPAHFSTQKFHVYVSLNLFHFPVYEKGEHSEGTHTSLPGQKSSGLHDECSYYAS